jgi:3-dehydroquinate dehydratase
LEGIFGADRVCGVIAGSTARDMMAQTRRALRATRIVEVRLDYLRNSSQRTTFLNWLKRRRLGATLIATCRR